MIQKGRNFVIVMVLALVSTACSDYFYPISSRNFAHTYNPGLTDIHPTILLHRVQTDSSELFIRIPVSDLAFPEFKRRDDMVAGIEVKYFVVDSANAPTFRDSGSVVFHRQSRPATNQIQFRTGFRHHPDSVRFVEVYIKDIISGAETSEVLHIHPDASNNSQRYYSYYSNPDYPFTRNFITVGDSTQISTSNATDSLWVYHLTPNKNDTASYDSVLKIATNSFFTTKKTGSYVINSTATTDGGLRFVSGDEHFPAIRTAETMVHPIRMLTNAEEWEKLLTYRPKIAVDTFWLVAAANTEEARLQIQVFYNRLQLANLKFSSHRQGWKTHAGKILTVAGLPDEVQYTNKGEVWYYFIKKNSKLQVPFRINYTTSELELLRSDSLFNGFMTRKINRWRRGKF
ncbi:MAG: GWxTD domain-containing protein [Salinivirgaceae bacterium]|nr:GWxTD domain-containing protein [Salinivirgaceae bacterium]